MKNVSRTHARGYKNLMVIFFGIAFAIVLSRIEAFSSFLLHLGGFGYIGAFFGGILFVSTFTVATGALILSVFAEKLRPLEIGLIAGLGAVIGDLVIFRLVKDSLSEEIEDIYKSLDRKRHIKRLFRSKYFNWMLPVLGAIIIASPLPDELGVSLMGISKMKTVPFAIISFFLNFLGIFLIVAASAIIKPQGR